MTEAGNPHDREEKLTELRAMQDMVDAASASLCFLDRGLRLVASNRHFRETWGHSIDAASGGVVGCASTGGKLGGRLLSEILPPDAYALGEPYLRLCLGGAEQEYRAASPDGTRAQRVRCVPARGTDGVVEGIVIFREDLEGGDELSQRLEDKEFALASKDAELRRIASTDALSGALNREAILSALEEELQRAERYGRPLSLIIFDLDRFKLVNDIHGRAAGDEAIRRLASTCLAAFRTTDRFGRYGGEEFLALLPEVDWEGAATAAERVRAGMQAERFRAPSLGAGLGLPRADDEFTVTVSAGVASFEKGLDADRLLARADGALYRAKEKGRNRVELHVRH